MEVAYYTCLNNECYKYRGIFTEGDQEHANCERARIYPEEEASGPSWIWYALPAALLAIAGATAFMISRGRRNGSDNLPPLGERRTQTWSGTEMMNNERKSHGVPPPIGPER